jgi:hypothetical protein
MVEALGGSCQPSLEAKLRPAAGLCQNGASPDQRGLATIVERENTTLVVDDEHRTMRSMHDQPPLTFNSSRVPRAQEIRGRCVHWRSYSTIDFGDVLARFACRRPKRQPGSVSSSCENRTCRISLIVTLRVLRYAAEFKPEKELQRHFLQRTGMPLSALGHSGPIQRALSAG